MKRFVLRIALLGVTLCTAGHGQQPATPSPADVQLHNQVIRQAVETAAPVKARVEQFFLHQKAFPASNSEAGMNLPQTYRTYDVQAITIGPNGVIDIVLTASSGVDGGIIRLTPAASKTSSPPSVEWSCRSPSYSTIADATGGTCEYTNQP